MVASCKNENQEVSAFVMRENDNKQVTIVGGGIAGLTVAKLLSEHNVSFALVEKTDKLGGHTKDWACMATDECKSCYCCSVFDYEDAVASSRKSEILLGHELHSVIRSSSGIHSVTLRQIESGAEREIHSSALVIAVGFETFDPTEKGFWGYGRIDGVITLVELNRLLRSDDLAQLSPDEDGQLNVAFFQCVGSRDKTIGANYCSQYCCSAAIRSALKVLHERPRWKISIFYVDLQVAGKTVRTLLDEAQSKGVRFLQGVPGEIQPLQDGGLRVISELDGENVVERFDKVVLSVGQRAPSSARAVADIIEAPLNEFGFFQTRSLFDAVRAPVDGIYIAGSCSGPLNITDITLNAGKVVSAIIADIEKTN